MVSSKVKWGPWLLVQDGMNSSREGFGASLMSWVHGGYSERLRQNRSPSGCDQPTRGENMSRSTTFHNGKTSKECAQTLSAH